MNSADGPTRAEPTPLEAAQARVMEQFHAICANPDDAATAADADAALLALDELLA